MEFVADTNIIFSLFKKDSFTRKCVRKHNLQLSSPEEQLSKELDKYSKEICSKSKIPTKSFNRVKELVFKLILSKEPSKDSLSKASKLISHKSDIPFLALALELNIPVWSNDSHFQEELVKNAIEVFTTEKLVKYFEPLK